MRALLTTAIRLVILLAAVFTSCRSGSPIDSTLAEAYALIEEGNLQEAQRKALQAEMLLGADPAITYREALAGLYGSLYYRQGLTAKADSCIRVALSCAEELNDTLLMMKHLFNLGLCESYAGPAKADFGRAAELARMTGKRSLLVSALEKQAQVYIATGEYETARQLLDESGSICAEAGLSPLEVDLTRCSLSLAEGKIDSALIGYRSIDPDELNVFGRLNRVKAIAGILTDKEDYKTALVYKDSVHLYTDSIRRLDGTKQVAQIEKDFRDDIARKNTRFRILLCVSVLVVIAFLIILWFAARNLRLSRRQIELTDRISALNARIAGLLPQEKEDEEAQGVAADSSGDVAAISRLIMEKCELSREVFMSLPQYELLKKLNLLRDLTAANKAEMKTVYDVIIGRFADCCSDLRNAFRGMTNDDCIFCVMHLLGCSREIISFALGASDEALRRRKSRIKQKLPEAIFAFFFSK